MNIYIDGTDQKNGIKDSLGLLAREILLLIIAVILMGLPCYVCGLIILTGD